MSDVLISMLANCRSMAAGRLPAPDVDAIDLAIAEIARLRAALEVSRAATDAAVMQVQWQARDGAPMTVATAQQLYEAYVPSGPAWDQLGEVTRGVWVGHAASGRAPPTREHWFHYCPWPGCVAEVVGVKWGCEGHWATLSDHFKSEVAASARPSVHTSPALLAWIDTWKAINE